MSEERKAESRKPEPEPGDIVAVQWTDHGDVAHWHDPREHVYSLPEFITYGHVLSIDPQTIVIASTVNQLGTDPTAGHVHIIGRPMIGNIFRLATSN